MLALLDFSKASEIADKGGVEIFKRRFFEPHAFERLGDCAKIPRKLGSRASVPRKGSALINWSMFFRTSSTLRNRIPLRAKNSPPSGRLIARITLV